MHQDEKFLETQFQLEPSLSIQTCLKWLTLEISKTQTSSKYFEVLAPPKMKILSVNFTEAIPSH